MVRNKPLLLIMHDVHTFFEFNSCQYAQRHPFTIYADLEALLVNTKEKRGKNMTIIHKQEPMSYGFIVKLSDDVPLELGIPHQVQTGGSLFMRY